MVPLNHYQINYLVMLSYHGYALPFKTYIERLLTGLPRKMIEAKRFRYSVDNYCGPRATIQALSTPLALVPDHRYQHLPSFH